MRGLGGVRIWASSPDDTNPLHRRRVEECRNFVFSNMRLYSIFFKSKNDGLSAIRRSSSPQLTAIQTASVGKDIVRKSASGSPDSHPHFRSRSVTYNLLNT
jgi:hypothetical protein